MFRAVDFKTSAGRINPLEFLQTLRGENWREVRVKNPAVKVFQLERGNEFFQTTVPVDRNLVDFDAAMLRAVETFASAREANVEQTLIELTTPVSDVLRVRLQNDACANGSVFFDDAIRLYGNLKSLIAAAASDVAKPAVSHRGARNANVDEFVKSCRFSQTEIGSYVVTAFLPLKNTVKNGVLAAETDFQDAAFSESLGRKTGSHIMESSACVIHDARESKPLETIGRSVLDKRFSVNFLEALKKLCEFGDKSQLEITGRWSSFATRNRPTNNNFTLSHDYANSLADTIAYVRETVEPKQTILSGVGQIERLTAEANASTRVEGEITLLALLGQGNKAKPLTMKLNAADYAKACQAHAQGQFVRFSGELIGKEFTCNKFNVCEEATLLSE